MSNAFPAEWLAGNQIVRPRFRKCRDISRVRGHVSCAAGIGFSVVSFENDWRAGGDRWSVASSDSPPFFGEPF